MTIAERNKKLKHFITCLKCEVSGKCCDDNCPTQYEAGHTGEIIENLEAISKLLEQKPETVTEFADCCRECGAKYGKALEQTRWIPVSERLPEAFEYVNCTCHSLIDDRDDWVIETVYIPQPSDSPLSDWGNIPMLNEGNCEVVAWMHRDIPQPYKAESEE